MNKYLISFDISDDKIQKKASDRLLNFGFRVQKSVFEGFLNPNEVQTLQSDLEALVNSETDSVRIYFLDKTADRESIIIGQGRRIEEIQYRIL